MEIETLKKAREAIEEQGLNFNRAEIALDKNGFFHFTLIVTHEHRLFATGRALTDTTIKQADFDLIQELFKEMAGELKTRVIDETK